MRAAELDRLWFEFHHAVNMTPRELSDWLGTRAESGEAPATGQQVARILAKRRTDLTDADLAVMRRVIDTVRFRCGPGYETTAGQPGWRDNLMNLGHDPFKPA
jgi:hypothetical protein